MIQFTPREGQYVVKITDKPSLHFFRDDLRSEEVEDRPVEEKAGRDSAVTVDYNVDHTHLGEFSGERLIELEPALSEILQSIHEGARMLVEARARDERLGAELCASLTAYTEWLGASFELPIESFPSFHDAEKMFLTPQGRLVVIDKRGKVDSRALGEHPTDVVLAAVWNTLPQLRSAIQRRTQRLRERISLLDRVSTEFRMLPTFSNEPREASEGQESERPETQNRVVT